MAASEGEDSCKCLLLDGRNVELRSCTGSDAFLTHAPGPVDWFTKNIGLCNAIRRLGGEGGGGVLSEEAKRQLVSTYFVVDSVARYSTRSLFAEKVPDGEIRAWLDHVAAELRAKGGDLRWRRTGVLEQHDEFLIVPCVSMFVHDAPAQLAMEDDFFGALSDFVGALEAPLMPCPDIAEAVCLLTMNVFMSLMTHRSNPWRPEKIFKKLESNGWLAWYIRCTSIPRGGNESDVPRPGILKIYDELLNCPEFIKKKFRAGQPCGEAVMAVLGGTCGRRQRKEVLLKLKAISSQAELLQPNDVGNFKTCRYCNKSDRSEEFQNKLMVCSRCLAAHYCSKECQRSDWKEHKKICQPAGRIKKKTHNACQQMVFNYAQKHYIAIMEKMVKFCHEKGLTKSDVLLELDFVPDASGVAPALNVPPIFAVKETRGYYEGTRPNEPDWVYRHGENAQTILDQLAYHHGKMMANHLLCFAQHPGGYTGTCKLQLQGSKSQSSENCVELFGDDAFDAFGEAINNSDFSALCHIFGPAMAHHLFRKQLEH